MGPLEHRDAAAGVQPRRGPKEQEMVGHITHALNTDYIKARQIPTTATPCGCAFAADGQLMQACAAATTLLPHHAHRTPEAMAPYKVHVQIARKAVQA